VDDIDLNREILGGLLAHEGALVDFASDGQAVLERIGTGDGGRYDVVLTDMLMPEMDGCELAKRLHERLPALPIIAVVSDAPSASEHRQCELAGVRGYLMKPIDPETMVLSVRDCLGGLTGTASSGISPLGGHRANCSVEHSASSSRFTTGD
jgi:CheY-like chemotaxis protein